MTSSRQYRAERDVGEARSVRAPVFPSARRRPGVYPVGGRVSLELGSPLTAVVRVWATSLASRRQLQPGHFEITHGQAESGRQSRSP